MNKYYFSLLIILNFYKNNISMEQEFDSFKSELKQENKTIFPNLKNYINPINSTIINNESAKLKEYLNIFYNLNKNSFNLELEKNNFNNCKYKENNPNLLKKKLSKIELEQWKNIVFTSKF